LEETKDKTENEADEATTVGMFLKYTRMKQKKSIEAVSDALCIRKIYIKALEEDDYETLAPVPYGVGFVRSYASYLGLNSDRIAQFYKQQAMPSKDKTIPVLVTKPKRAVMPTKRQTYIALLAVLLLYLFWFSLDLLKDSKNNVVTEQPNVQFSERSLSDSDHNVYSPDVAELLSDGEIIQQGTDSGSQSAEQITVIDGDYDEVENQKKPEDRLKIQLKGASWLELKDKDKVYLSGVYQKGFEYAMPAVDGLVLSIGRYYNVDVYVDGKLTKVATPKKQTNVNLDPFFKH